MIKNNLRCPICGYYLLETNKIGEKYYLSCLHCKSNSPAAFSVEEAFEDWIARRRKRQRNDNY